MSSSEQILHPDTFTSSEAGSSSSYAQAISSNPIRSNSNHPLQLDASTSNQIGSSSSYRHAISTNPVGPHSFQQAPSAHGSQPGVSTRPSSTSSTFHQQGSTTSTLRDEKLLRKHMKVKPKRLPSDRIPSRSCCGVFFYNIPRSSIMVTVPGFIILAIGALLLATTDLNQTWSDGGVLLVALVFLIVGGVWTMGGVIYWAALWWHYRPREGQEYRWTRSQLTSASSALSPRVPITPAGSSASLTANAFANPVFTFDDISPRIISSNNTPVGFSKT